VKRSNVQIETNVFVLTGDHYEDRRFMAQVRDFKTLRKLPYLTALQEFELESGMYCSIHPERKSALVFGRGWDDSGRHECRCTHDSCHLYSSCSPTKPAESERTPESPIPVVEGSAADYGSWLPQPIELPEGQSSSAVPGVHMVFGPPAPTSVRDVPELPSEEPEGDAYSTVITHPIDGCQLVIAPPGSGKTYCVIERLKHLVDFLGDADPGEVLVLCFTKTAVTEIRDRLQAAAGNREISDSLMRLDVRTFDSFASRLLYDYQEEMTNLDYDARVQKAIDLICTSVTSDMRHIIVDEVQDLQGVRARLVQALIRHRPEGCGFTLMGDPYQGIFDYLAKKSAGPALDSEGLLDWVREHEKDKLVEVGLTKNYRHVGNMVMLTERSRQLLVSRSLPEFYACVGEHARLVGRHEEHLLVIPEDMGRVAILCRNNGEVLRVSRRLRNIGIVHAVRRVGRDSHNPGWIYRLRMRERAVIGPEYFRSFIGLDGDTADRLYENLRTLAGGRSAAFTVDDLLRAMAAGQTLREDLQPEQTAHRVTVTTIHQAKGRQYDTVFALHSRRSSDDLYGEAKVLYVAVTRARRAFFQLEPDTSAQLRQLNDGRWSTRWWQDKGLAGIEVGLPGDWDEESFVSTEVHTDPDPAEVQTYLAAHVQAGDEVTLRWDTEARRYAVRHKSALLGFMSRRFNDAVREAVQGRRSRWPKLFDQVHVEQVYTVVKKPETLGRHIAEPAFSTGVWLGVALIGLGARRS
jgi:DNA helicase-2/ATP-dependent DNA helicase PcrA